MPTTQLVEERAVGRGRGMDHEQVKGEPRNRCLDPDFGRAEPIFELAPVQEHLQGADRQAQGGETEEVKRFAAAVPRLADEYQNADCGENPERDVDEEHPAPIVLVGQPTAERRPDDRTQDDPHAPDRHRLGVPVGRVDLQKHRLRQRDERRAADTLQQAIDHDLAEARRDAAQGRSQSEAGDRNEEHPLDAKASCEAVIDAIVDQAFDDVGRHYPGNLVLRGGKAALHVRQRDIGNRRVDPLHEGRQHDRNGDCAPVRDRGARLIRHRSAARVAGPVSQAKMPWTLSSQGRR